jgi:hypothetical protein
VKYDNDSEKLKDDLYEKMQDYAEKNKTTMREVLRNTVSHWLDDGLFVDGEYSPICNSDSKQTCNDADTKLTHKEILRQWLATKEKVKVTIQKLVDDGRLQIENRENDFFGVKEMVKIITGESLYNLEGDFVFASDYRKQADDLKPLGYLTLFARQQYFFEEYASLLAFADIYKKLNRIYDIDLSYRVDGRIESLKNSANLLNRDLENTTEKLILAIYKKYDIKFLIEITDYKAIHVEDIKPGTGEAETYYSDELKKLFGVEFQS